MYFDFQIYQNKKLEDLKPSLKSDAEVRILNAVIDYSKNLKKERDKEKMMAWLN